MSQEIRPFKIRIPDEAVDDLKARLDNVRIAQELPAEETEKAEIGIPVSEGWKYGVPLSFLQPLLERWRFDFDWRKAEAKLNEYPQYITEIDGQDIHFVHVKSGHQNATPLMLLHGWPNTFTEYLGLVGPLTDPTMHGGDPADAFDVVIPSYPGFAFSAPTKEAGWNHGRMAEAFAELMSRLGYDRYGVHGNDAGAIAGPQMGRIAGNKIIGVHVNQIFSFPSGDPAEFEGLSPEEMAGMEFVPKFLEHAIHDHAQSGQPHTIGHVLADSPYAQLAWVSQLLGESVGADDILTIASIYWFTNTGGTSARSYFEDSRRQAPTETTTFPIGLASFAYDMHTIRKFADRDHGNIVSWNEYDRGGHWSAHEAPDLLINDIRGFFKKLS